MNKCKTCLYFDTRDVPEIVRRNYGNYAIPDGYCTKIFPRGYTGAGKEGGYVSQYKMACFQYERREA